MNTQIESNNNHEDKVIYFNELLNLAHEQGLKSIRTQIVQMPSAENGYTCLHHARVELDNQGCFEGTGDANPDNVDEAYSPHYIRISETRALARALRFALNISLVAFEELGGHTPKRELISRSSSQKQAPQIRVLATSHEATERQHKAIWGISKAIQLSKRDLEGLTQQRFGCSLQELSKAQASQFIDELKRLQSA